MSTYDLYLAGALTELGAAQEAKREAVDREEAARAKLSGPGSSFMNRLKRYDPIEEQRATAAFISKWKAQSLPRNSYDKD